MCIRDRRKAWADISNAYLERAGHPERIDYRSNAERGIDELQMCIRDRHISIYFNYIGRFENEVTQLAEPTEQEIRQMREEIEEAKKEKSRAYHRKYSREYRARNLEKQREYELSLIHI